MKVELRAFGPMEITFADRSAPLTSRLQRVLLASLVIRRGAVVPVNALAAAMWPSAAPDALTVTRNIRFHVHRLRRALGEAGTITYVAPGYALTLPASQIDVCRFEDLVAQGQAALASGSDQAAAQLLREAVALHRGPAFQGLEDADQLRIEAQRFDELRMTAIECRIAAELTLGQHARLISELEALVASHPLRERFRAQLMTALYRAGRKAEALATYRAGRKFLVDELGIEPNQECQDLERAIHLDDPRLSQPRGVPLPPAASGPPPSPPPPSSTPPATGPAPPVVHQLPPDVTSFTGRAQPLRRLDELAGVPDQPPITRTVVITGTAGAGKTALALRWAHRARDSFPDGQLYVNLRGYASGAPVTAGQALARFLRALGMPAEQVPGDPDEAAAAYRSQLAGRRVLLLLDNAIDADQVRPLLPGGGTCLTLVTSRDRLAGLVALEGASWLPLDVLPASEALALLIRLLGPDRVAADPTACGQLVEQCGRLPLALRIAAAHLVAEPDEPVSGYLTRLRRDGGLDALSVTGDPQATVRVAFDASYHRLAAPTRQMFRLVGLVPGTDLTAGVLAALADTSPERAAGQLARLAEAHLVEERTAGRYTSHDLLRVYARERIRAEEPPAATAAARDRLFAYYRHTADAATSLLYPGALRLPDPEHPPRPWLPDRFRDPAEALRWLDRELPNLVAAVQQAAAAGSPAAWLISNGLRGYLQQRAPAADAELILDKALATADAAGDQRAAGCVRLGRAVLRSRRGDTSAALADNTRALAAFRGAGWVEAEAMAVTNLGVKYAELGDLRQAVAHNLRAVALFEQTRSWSRLPIAVGNLPLTLLKVGRRDEALHYARRTVELTARCESGYIEALNHSSLGAVYWLLGEWERARSYFIRALVRYRQHGDREGESFALAGLAEIHRDRGNPRLARRLATTALAIAQELDHTDNQVSALLALARVHELWRQPGPAQQAGGQALALARMMGDPYAQCRALLALAGSQRYDPVTLATARSNVDLALQVARTGGFRLLEGQALTTSAEIWAATGEPQQALMAAGQALAIHSETGHRAGAAGTAALLDRLRQTQPGPPAVTARRSPE